MAMNARQTVVGVFDEPAMADNAVDALQNAGFDANQIHYAGHGTATGTSGGGFFEGLKRFFTGEDLAGTRNDDTEDFSHMGFRDDEARWYNDQYNAGRAVVSVRTADRVDEAMQILRTNGAYNYDMRAGSTTGSTMVNDRTAGTYTQTTDYAQSQPADYAMADRAGTAMSDVNTDQERSMRLREEQLQANKDRVQAGEVKLHKDVVEEQKTLNVPVTHEEVYVERRDAGNVGQVDDTPIGQDETVRVPVSEEQVNVSKQPVVTGEVSVGKRAVTDNQQVSDTVQREEPRVVRQGDVNVQGSGANMVDNTRDTMGNRASDRTDDTYNTRRTVDDTTATDTPDSL